MDRIVSTANAKNALVMIGWVIDVQELVNSSKQVIRSTTKMPILICEHVINAN